MKGGPRKATWSEPAELDVAEACDYLSMTSPELVSRFLGALEETLTFLVENPEVGKPRESQEARMQGIRSWAVRAFSSYLVFYTVTHDGLRVVRLLHGARDLPDQVRERADAALAG